MKKGLLSAVLIVLALTVLITGCNSRQTEPGDRRTVVSETLICDISNKSVYSPVIYSPDFRRVAYFTETAGKRQVVINGETTGKSYDEVFLTFSMFSPDGSRTAFQTLSYGSNSSPESTWHIIIDGEESGSNTRVDAVVFSPDSNHIAYIADGNIYLDEKRFNPAGTEVSTKNGAVFSPDSIDLTCVMTRNGKQSVAHEGNDGAWYDEIGSVVFSPDGSRLVYSARNGPGWFIVEGNNPGNHYEGIGTIAFSPDGNRLAYVAEKEGLIFIVADGIEGKRYVKKQALKFAPSLVFSPDGTNLAYSYEEPVNVTTGTNPGYVVVNDEPEEVTNGTIGSLQFSPDGKRLAYVEFRMLTAEKMPYLIVINGEKGKKYDFISDFVFSPDSRHYAFQVKTPANELFVVADGIEGNRYECIDATGMEKPDEYGIAAVVFESANRFSYLARKGLKIYRITEELTD